ncbi:hypothetical protein KC19_11G003900 [Ceratodon purpureus]|uniref:Uncharacterized protein n=1 Tax=Ceratodon purpureus TaxID=3225 RepID=A0A8T0GCN9_CERPU|nr:hypothetical protein KC19_11G003900 [Ceratodon purpureus]
MIFCLAAESTSNNVKAIYAFGDSYVDTGNVNHENGSLTWDKPYGITWPGYADGRFSDGQIETDYIAHYFNLPSPVPFNQILNYNTYNGINFAVGSSGVTYANKKPTLNVQVNQFEECLENGIIKKQDLQNSIAFIGTGVNDYTSYKGLNETIPALLDNVVDGLAWNVLRLFKMGIHNILVSNLAPMSCFPQYTAIYNYTHCLDNTTLTYKTQELHNIKLENAMTSLDKNVEGLKILLLDQSKAFQYLVDSASILGFEDSVIPCCKGAMDNDVLKCGKDDQYGHPLYSLCKDPTKALFWDGWHLTETAYEAIIQLYTFKTGFTKLADNLKSWL